MKERLVWRDLVHDVINLNETTEGAETGCGMILRATPEKFTERATSCLVCISGEFEFQRELGAMETLKKSPALLPEYQEMLRKKLSPS